MDASKSGPGAAVGILLLLALWHFVGQYWPIILPLAAICCIVAAWYWWKHRSDLPAAVRDIPAAVTRSPELHQGIVLGRRGKDILTHDGEAHVFGSGAPGTGKSTSLIIPTLFSWPTSAWVYDPKEELADITADYRRSLGPVHILDFTGGPTAHFNPLDTVRWGTDDEIEDVGNLVEDLNQKDVNTNSTGEHFRAQANRLLKAVILLTGKGGTLEDANIAIGGDIKAELDDMVASPNKALRRDGAFFLELANAPKPEQWQGIVTSAMRPLAVFDFPRVNHVVCKGAEGWKPGTPVSDFTPASLVCGDKPVTLYVQVRPSDTERLAPLVRILLSSMNTALLANQRKVGTETKRHQLLLLVDEFAQLGRCPKVIEAMRVGRSYGYRVMITAHDPMSMEAIYGKEPVVSQCRIEVHTGISADTAERMSKRIGTEEVERSSHSHKVGLINSGHGVSTSLQTRPSVKPEQISQMANDTQMVFVDGKPFVVGKVRWWQDPAILAVKSGQEPASPVKSVKEKATDRAWEALTRKRAFRPFL